MTCVSAHSGSPRRRASDRLQCKPDQMRRGNVSRAHPERDANVLHCRLPEGGDPDVEALHKLSCHDSFSARRLTFLVD